MRIATKFSLLILISGFFTILIISTLFFYIERDSEIDTTLDRLTSYSSDLAYHLETSIKSFTQRTQTISCTTSLKQVVRESNYRYSVMSETERNDSIKRSSELWQQSDLDSSIVSQAMSNEIATYFSNLQKSFPGEIGEIFLTNRFGVVVSTTKKLTTFDHAHKYWWKGAYDGGVGRVYIDDRGFDTSVGSDVIGIVVPVYEEDQIIGMLKINYIVDTILGGALENVDSSDPETYIIRMGGMILQSKSELTDGMELPEDIVAWITQGSMVSRSIYQDTQERFLSYSLLDFPEGYVFGGSSESIDHKKGNNGEPWVIVSILEKRDALLLFYQDLSRILILGFVIIIINGSVAIIISKVFTRPIRSAVDYVERLGRGDLGLTIPVETKDEFGNLLSSMNHMALTLDSTMTSKTELLQQISLREHEENRYRQLFDQMNEGFCHHELIYDEEGKPVDYRFLIANPSYEKILGLKREEFLGKGMKEILPHTDDSLIYLYSEIERTGDSASFEYYAEDLKKHFMVFAFSPQKGEFATLITDITNLKTVEKQLILDNELLETTLDSISEAVIVTDPSGVISFYNAETQNLLGWDDKKRGKLIHEICDILRDERGNCLVQSVLTNGNPINSTYPRSVMIDQELKVLEYSLAPIGMSEDQDFGVVIILKDVTEKEQMRDHLILSEKLESLGVLAGGIAHDFNNYLAGIFGNIELSLLMLKDKDDHGVTSYLQNSMDVFESAKGLAKQLMTFSKSAPVRMEINSIRDILQTCINFVFSGSNIFPVIDIQEGLWTCLCDRQQIEQSIDNLLINAKQAMAGTGQLSISARNISSIEHEVQGVLTTEDYIEITIVDTGIGMSKEIIQKIFDPFFSTKETGHGLGLAMVFSIIEKHKGWIEVDSELGRGTTFTLFIPAHFGDLKSKETVDDPIHYRGRGRVLVMDDQVFMQEVFSNMLQEVGFTVTVVDNGEDALQQIDYAKNSEDPFRFCILDLTLPGKLSGKDVVQLIKRFSPELPCFAASGYAEDPIMSNPSDYGFEESIKKPFTIKELLTMLKDFSEPV